MYPDSIRSKQRGAGLPVAIFVITVLALLVAGMSQLQESGAQSVSLQIQSQRAFYAAESGAQVAVAEVLAGRSCAAVTRVEFEVNGLAGCHADLVCPPPEIADNGDGTEESVYTITSTGRCGAGVDASQPELDASQRRVRVRVR